jgi:hypothetical protein
MEYKMSDVRVNDQGRQYFVRPSERRVFLTGDYLEVTITMLEKAPEKFERLIYKASHPKPKQG